MSEVAAPKAIYLKDYTPPDFLIDSTYLYFDLQDAATEVTAVLAMKRNPLSKNTTRSLILDGDELALKSILINGEVLPPENYKVDNEHLTIFEVPEQFTLETQVEIKPKENTKLAGLYESRGNYCTQCESHGFRRITYFLDRPDVLTRFTTAISADSKRYPTLLSNGNLIEQKELSGNKHWVKWEDPSLKPCYLFALVAGDFDCIEDQFITLSKRPIALRVYVEKGKKDQAHFSMESLKQAMKWDEETFGREYDLDIYMIVAVNDFNFGAMENKGLNIFNDKYILANQKTATDDDFLNVQSVIGHEYFHNWSGNRVTCRDWFQITLKEGLTIFRDQSFSGDLNSKVVERISEVDVIRAVQFAQDAGPMAHPIRPDSYIEINNFYTVTVYNKGAEVIRMIQTIIGKNAFRKGMDLYFAEHDGQAVTADDFVESMEKASGVDLTQFKRWYSQAGTPVLDVETHYDEKNQTYTLKVTQSCPPTPGQPQKENFHIPLAIGLLDKQGKDMRLQIKGENKSSPITTAILNVKNKNQEFQFVNISEKPIPSLLRNFSAPVKLNYAYSDNELLFLLAHDSDGFNRWDSGQKLAVKIILQLVADQQQKKPLILNPAVISAFKLIFSDKDLDKALLAEMLVLPRFSYLMELMPVADVDAIYEVREFIKDELVKQLREVFLSAYNENQNKAAYHFDAKQAGQRSLKNTCLAYLMQSDDQEARDLCYQQFLSADNMTDEVGALGALISSEGKERQLVLEAFYKKWQHEDLVLDKWFSLQAISELPHTLEAVKVLMKHPAYNMKNPNRVRSLVGSFCHGNYTQFHAVNGEGYRFLADQVLLIDPINSQLSARLIEPLIRWRKFDDKRQALMKAQLERILAAPKLSKDIYEIVSKCLH